MTNNKKTDNKKGAVIWVSWIYCINKDKVIEEARNIGIADFIKFDPAIVNKFNMICIVDDSEVDTISIFISNLIKNKYVSNTDPICLSVYGLSNTKCRTMVYYDKAISITSYISEPIANTTARTDMLQ